MKIEKMYSGNLQLVIIDSIGSENFSVLADNWVRQHSAIFISEAFSFDVQLWVIEYKGEKFYLATDVWGEQFTLESMSKAGDKIIQELFQKENN